MPVEKRIVNGKEQYVNVVGNHLQVGEMTHNKDTGKSEFRALNPGKSTSFAVPKAKRAPIQKNIIGADGKRQTILSPQSNLPTGTAPTGAAPVYYGQNAVTPDLSNRFQGEVPETIDFANGTTGEVQGGTRSGSEKVAAFDAAGIAQGKLSDYVSKFELNPENVTGTTEFYTGNQKQVVDVSKRVSDLQQIIERNEENRNGRSYRESAFARHSIDSSIAKATSELEQIRQNQAKASQGYIDLTAEGEAGIGEAKNQAQIESARGAGQGGEQIYDIDSFAAAVAQDVSVGGFSGLEEQGQGLLDRENETYNRQKGIYERQKQKEIDRRVRNRMAGIEAGTVASEKIEAGIRAEIEAEYDDPDNRYNLALDQLEFNHNNNIEDINDNIQIAKEKYITESGRTVEQISKARSAQQFEAFRQKELAKDPTLSDTYLKDKWSKTEKYVDGGGNAENIELWESKMERGEIDTSNLVNTFQSAVDIAGTSEGALKLMTATASASLAKEAQEEWVGQQYGEGARSIKNLTNSVNGMFTGENKDVYAVKAFVDNASENMPDAWIADQLEAISSSLSVDPTIKSVVDGFLQEPRFKTTSSSSDYLTEAEFKGGVGTPEQRAAFRAGTTELAELKDNIEEQSGLAKGVRLSFQEKIDIPAIGKMLYGARISDKETDRVQGIVTDPEAADLDRFGLITKIMGFDITQNTELGDALMDQIIAVNPEEGLAGFDMLGLSKLLNNGNTAGAVRKVESFSNSKAKNIEGEKFISESFVESNIRKYNSVEDTLDALGAELSLGPVGGSIAEWLGRAKGKDQKIIAGKMSAAVAQMRNELLGSAVTEAEERFLADVLPKSTDTAEEIASKLDTLKQNALIELNSMRSVYGMPELREAEILDKKLKQGLYEQTSFYPEDLEAIGLDISFVENLSPEDQKVFGKNLNTNNAAVKSMVENNFTVDEMMEVFSAKTSPEGAGTQNSDFLKNVEGFRTEAYLDSAGIPTVGYGFTEIDGRPVQMGDTITPEQAEIEFEKQKEKHSNYKDAVTVDLTEDQKTALASFEYNLGPGIWKTTGKAIIDAINAGDLDKASNIMLQHNKAKDPDTKELVFVQGLENRRKKEIKLLNA